MQYRHILVSVKEIVPDAMCDEEQSVDDVFGIGQRSFEDTPDNTFGLTVRKKKCRDVGFHVESVSG